MNSQQPTEGWEVLKVYEDQISSLELQSKALLTEIRKLVRVKALEMQHHHPSFSMDHSSSANSQISTQ